MKNSTRELKYITIYGLMLSMHCYTAEFPVPIALRQVPMIKLIGTRGQFRDVPLEIAMWSDTIKSLLLSEHFEESQTKTIELKSIGDALLDGLSQFMWGLYNFRNLKGKKLFNAIWADPNIKFLEPFRLKEYYTVFSLANLLEFKQLAAYAAYRLLVKIGEEAEKSYHDQQDTFTSDIDILEFLKAQRNRLSTIVYKTLETMSNYPENNTSLKEFAKYYLLRHPERSNLRALVNLDDLTFSIRDYLDFLPFFLKPDHESNNRQGKIETSFRIRPLGLDSLDGLLEIPKIETAVSINLSNNKLTYVPVNIFTLLPNLKMLDLYGNPIEETNKQELLNAAKEAGATISF